MCFVASMIMARLLNWSAIDISPLASCTHGWIGVGIAMRPFVGKVLEHDLLLSGRDDDNPVVAGVDDQRVAIG